MKDRAMSVARFRILSTDEDRVLVKLDDGRYALGKMTRDAEGGFLDIEVKFTMEELQLAAVYALTGDERIRTVCSGQGGRVLAAGVVLAMISAGANGAPDQEVSL